MKKSMLVLFMVLVMLAAMAQVSWAGERFLISGWLKSVDEVNSVVVIVVNPYMAKRYELPKQITVSMNKRYIKSARRLDDNYKRTDPNARAEVLVSLEVVDGKYVGSQIVPMPHCDR